MTNILGKSKEKEQAYINDYATLVVPQNKRRSSFSLTMVLIGPVELRADEKNGPAKR